MKENDTMSENSDKFKEFVEHLAAMMDRAPEDPSDDPDFYPNDYAGGNIDDAWYHGYHTGIDVQTWSIVSEARKLLGLPTE